MNPEWRLYEEIFNELKLKLSQYIMQRLPRRHTKPMPSANEKYVSSPHFSQRVVLTGYRYFSGPHYYTCMHQGRFSLCLLIFFDSPSRFPFLNLLTDDFTFSVRGSPSATGVWATKQSYSLFPPSTRPPKQRRLTTSETSSS